MTGTLHITGDADADRLLSTDPLALLVGMPAMGDYMLVILREALDAVQTLVLS
jgi:hypothetical protein